MAYANRTSWTACLLLFLVGCGNQNHNGGDITPDGWKRVEVDDCCSIALPSGSTLKPLADPIDDSSFQIDGDGYKGVLTITRMGSGIGPPEQGSTVSTQTLEINGRPARLASYVPTDKSQPSERRLLLWTFEGNNDGTGRNLILDVVCSAEACEQFGTIAESLRRSTSTEQISSVSNAEVSLNIKN